MAELLDQSRTTDLTPTQPQEPSLESFIAPTSEESRARLEKYSSLHPALAQMLDRASSLGLSETVDNMISRIAFLIQDEKARPSKATEATNEADRLLTSNKALYYSLPGSLEEITRVAPKRELSVSTLEQQKEFHPQMLFITDTSHSNPDQLHEVLDTLIKTLNVTEVASLQSSRQASEFEASSAVDFYPGGNEIYKIGSSITQEAHFEVPGRGVMVFKIIRVNLEPDYEYVAEGSRPPMPQTVTAMMVFEPTQQKM